MLYIYQNNVEIPPRSNNASSPVSIEIDKLRQQHDCLKYTKIAVTFFNARHKLTVIITGLGQSCVFRGHNQTIIEEGRFSEVATGTPITIIAENLDLHNTLIFSYDISLEGISREGGR